MQTNLKDTVHFFMASKGGVGKTTLSALTAEWLAIKGAPPVVFDADAKNEHACISEYKGLAARKLDALLQKKSDGSEEINEAGFSALLTSLLEEEGPHVIDTGANTYTHMIGYIKELALEDMLADAGKEVFVHTIIAGGDACEETVSGMQEIIATLPNWKLVIWVNEYHAPAEMLGGEHFLESAPFADAHDRLKHVITMKKMTNVVRQAHNRFGKLRMLTAEAMAVKTVEPQDRFAFAGWGRDAFKQLDAAFGPKAAEKVDAAEAA